MTTTATGEEIGRRGQETYENTLRALLETGDNIGKIVSIDIESGDYDYRRDTPTRRCTASASATTQCTPSVGHWCGQARNGTGNRARNASSRGCRLPVAGASRLCLECVVGTGFAGALTLAPDAIAALGLPFFQEIDANLANDADVKTAVYVATIVWEGREVEVAVLAMGRRTPPATRNRTLRKQTPLCRLFRRRRSFYRITPRGER